MTDGGLSDSDADVEKAYAKAVLSNVKDISKFCEGTASECKDALKSEMATMYGKKVDAITDVEVSSLNRKASVSSALESVQSCASLKKSNASSTCADFEAVFEASSLGDESTLTGARKKTATQALKGEIVASAAKETTELCLEETDTTALKACFDSLETDQIGSVSDVVFEGVSDAVKAVKVKRAQEDALVEVLGESFSSCTSAGTIAADCLKSVKDKLTLVGSNESSTSVLKKYQSDVFAQAATSCTGDECVSQGKALLTANGMEERQFATVRRTSSLKASAESLAECMESGETEANCEVVAKEDFETIAGQEYTDAVKAMMKGIASSVQAGNSTEMRLLPILEVDLVTSGTACDNATTTDFVKQLNATKSLADYMNVTVPDCALVDSKAQLSAAVVLTGKDESQISTLAAAVVTELNPSRRLGRGLADTEEAYADQSSVICDASDAACGVIVVIEEAASTTAATVVSNTQAISMVPAAVALAILSLLQ